MKYEIVNGLIIVSLDPFFVIGIAVMSFFLGRILRSHSKLLQSLSIPVPFLGGFPVAIAVLALRLTDSMVINFDPELNALTLKIFLSLISLFGTWKLIFRGLRTSIVFWSLAIVLGALQAFVGLAGAALLGEHPHFGLLLGTVSMIGGYDTVSSFAPVIANMDGIKNADSMAMAAVTLGVVLSLMIGAPLGEWLIKKYNLVNHNSMEFDNDRLVRSIQRDSRPFYQKHAVECMKIVGLVFVAMAAGEWTNNHILKNVLLPDYVSCMIFAVIFRNAADKLNLFSVDGLALRTLTKLILTLFIAMSVCSLRLDLVLGLTPQAFFIFVSEILLNLLFARFVYFRCLGRNFDGMLLAVGGMSFSMGVTANGLSNMQSLCEKYGPATQGFLVLAIVGSILINFSNGFLIEFLLKIM